MDRTALSWDKRHLSGHPAYQAIPPIGPRRLLAFRACPLEAIVTRRSQILEMLTMERNRLGSTRDDPTLIDRLDLLLHLTFE